MPNGKKQIFHPDPDFMESILGKEFCLDPQSCFHDKIIKWLVVARSKTQKRLAWAIQNPEFKAKWRWRLRQTASLPGIIWFDRGPIPTKYHFMRTICRSKMENAFWWGINTWLIPEEEWYSRWKMLHHLPSSGYKRLNNIIIIRKIQSLLMIKAMPATSFPLPNSVCQSPPNLVAPLSLS